MNFVRTVTASTLVLALSLGMGGCNKTKPEGTTPPTTGGDTAAQRLLQRGDRGRRQGPAPVERRGEAFGGGGRGDRRAADALGKRDVSLETDAVRALCGRVAFGLDGDFVEGRLQLTRDDVAALTVRP